ncbi:MAG: hydrogenase maturation nickel metallochaperone HypA [Methylococcaceae bacterium]|nr:hydrogenase maturation nickel metallochaperone HypA [Methylococcaceae bacterium]
MHELSLCDDLLSQVGIIARENKASSVNSITLQIGPLSGVEPSLLESAFVMMREGTIAENAQFLVQISSVKVSCGLCGKQSEAAANHLVCGICGSFETTLISGDELILASVEMNCIA